MEQENKTILGLVEGIRAPEENQDQIDAKIECLEELIDITDKIDYAIGFHTFAKGFHPAIDLTVESRNPQVRSKAAELVATCVKDNPISQAWAFEHRALQKLFAMHRGQLADGSTVRPEGPTEGERTKALSALSALIQNTPGSAGEMAFLQAKGLDLLKEDLGAQIGVRLKVKALFFLQWLLRGNQAARQAALDLGLSVDLALSCIDEDDEVVQNGWLGLDVMTKHDQAAALQQVSARDPNMPGLIKNRIAAIDTEAVDESTIDLAHKLVQDLGL
mmetsp:Transcript_9232/g.14572  ORF Transcript_9232/g.14572 Transcript_9232/m.14572 type:complete len:275 (-) Transcript_9232:76-900(-)